MNINLFNDVKNIINYFNIIFKNKFYIEEKQILYPFLHKNLKQIYSILYKKKTFIKKYGLTLDDAFFSKFNNILNFDNKRGGGIDLIINIIENNLFNTFKISSKLNKKDTISAFFNKLFVLYSVNEASSNPLLIIKNTNIIDKQLLIYFRKLLKNSIIENKKLYNSENVFFDNNFLIYLNSYKNDRNIVDINRLIKNFDNLSFDIYLKFLSEIFKTNIIEKENKIIFLIIIIFGLNVLLSIISELKFNKEKFNYDKFIIIFMILCFLLENIEGMFIN